MTKHPEGELLDEVQVDDSIWDECEYCEGEGMQFEGDIPYECTMCGGTG
jgi:DnaJ-class molecular chaperone